MKVFLGILIGMVGLILIGGIMVQVRRKQLSKEAGADDLDPQLEPIFQVADDVDIAADPAGPAEVIETPLPTPTRAPSKTIAETLTGTREVPMMSGQIPSMGAQKIEPTPETTPLSAIGAYRAAGGVVTTDAEPLEQHRSGIESAAGVPPAKVAAAAKVEGIPTVIVSPTMPRVDEL